MNSPSPLIHQAAANLPSPNSAIGNEMVSTAISIKSALTQSSEHNQNTNLPRAKLIALFVASDVPL